MKKSNTGWALQIEDPVEGRVSKPRDQGLTMVLDKGIGIRQMKDLMEMAGEYIDVLKLGFGTSNTYPGKILKEKIKLALEYQLDIYPGGTLFEVAISQNKLEEFLNNARELGFTAVEISNGTYNVTGQLRQQAINKARSLGFKVFTEVGKKDRNNPLSLEEMKKQIEEDLEAGAEKIIIEGRESGKGISIYRSDGSIDMAMLEGILHTVRGQEEVIIWEAPLKKQQVVLIKNLGPNVNLGNVAIDEVIALESLRRGLRGDTFRLTLEEKEQSIISGQSEESRVGA